jgi:EmrB/QacA subfamily drug resistance transporter
MIVAVDAKRRVLVATILGSSIAFVDTTVVNVALPSIGRHLALGLAGRQWVYLTYSLALAAFYLPAGAIGDRVGRKSTFVGGAVAFAAASALAGASPTGGVLLVARTLQGVAAAFLTVSSLALLRATFAEESGRAVGLWTAWSGIATVVGPPAGGALVEWVSWRWIFFLNLPLAAGATLLARGADDPHGERARPFDVPGAALLALGLGGLTYTLVERGPWWLLAPALGLLALGLVHERRTEEPMLPLGLFRVRLFTVANAETLLVYGGLGASTFFLVLYLQTVGFTAFESSLPLVPTSVVMLLLAARFGRLADRNGPRLYLAVGPAVMATGMLLWELITSRTSWLALGAGTLVFSLGLSVTVAPITATALAAVPSEHAGLAAGVNNTVARIGGLVAVAVVGLVVAVVGGGLTVGSFRAGMTLAAGLTFAGAAVGGAFLPSRTPRGSRG